MSDDMILEVVQAHKDGKRVQVRKLRQSGWKDGTWYDVENPRWDFDNCDYRVSPTEELCPCCGKPR